MRPSPELVQVTRAHYDFIRYVTPQRWASYYSQIHEVLKVEPKSVLEVGVGLGVMSSILNLANISVATLDLDPALGPTLTGSVLDIPADEGSFDLACAFQVLEHLEFSHFQRALRELSRVSRGPIIISLPDSRVVYPWTFQLPKRVRLTFHIKKPRLWPPKHVFDGQHYWEIGKRGYAETQVRAEIKRAGLKVVRSYRIPENPYHHMYVLLRTDGD